MPRSAVKNGPVRFRLRICRFMLRQGWVYVSATVLGALMEAEEAGLVSDAWRGNVDTRRALELIGTRTDTVQRRWDTEFLHLRRLIGRPAVLTRAEAVLVLALRSELEWGARFLRPVCHQRLSRLDRKLRAVLTRDTRVFESARATSTAAVERRLPRHWWWRGNSPAGSR